MSEVAESEVFAYNAPQFCNLGTANIEDDPQVEEYFNYDHENIPKYEDISSEEDDIGQRFYTPLKFDEPQPQVVLNNLRKSMSMGNLLPQLKTTAISRPGKGSKDRLNALAQPKYGPSSANDRPAFMSSAEMVAKFQSSTPARFHTTSARARAGSADRTVLPGPVQAVVVRAATVTMPHSPALQTKTRSRPTMYMPREVREEQELEHMKKLQIKAKPIPKLILGPLKPIINYNDKKPATVVAPFNITQVAAKKPVEEAGPAAPFHARPVPKTLYQKGKLGETEDTKPKPLKAIHTKPEPFSFQTRQEEMLKKRDQLITKAIEEEKKGREFHARPIPKNVYKSPMKNTLKGANSRENLVPKSPMKNFLRPNSRENIAPHNANIKPNNNSFAKSLDTTFKAKPANVLKKQPFVPKLNLRPLTEISAFNLNTERRIAEREIFEAKMKQREETLALNDKTTLEEREKMDKIETLKMRKEMEVKANPIRHFKPLTQVTPKEVTIPQTPKFLKPKGNISTE